MLKRKEKLQFESPERLNRLVEGSKIVGDLFADSSLRIDGEVQGNISTSSKVVVGENGLIKGNLVCQEADIEGTINGTVSIEGLLILRDKAKVIGDIQTAKLHVEEGAVFLGNCSMGKPDPNNKRVEVSKTEAADNVVY